MNDPHVVSLRYRVSAQDGIEIVDPPAVTDERKEFSFVLHDEILTAEMAEHFSSVADARAVVDRYLLSWEIHAAIRLGRPVIKFGYDSSQVIDQAPNPGQIPMLRVEGRGVVVSGDSASATIRLPHHPEPPEGFLASPDVETIWARYLGWKDGREPLLAMTYFVLTVLEASAGGRKMACQRFNIDREVLNRLGELSSERGDRHAARKMPRSGDVRPLAADESHWLTTLVPLLILQIGEAEAGFCPAPLTMEALADL